MKLIREKLALIVSLLLIVAAVCAQNPYGDNYRDHNTRNRQSRRCTQSYANKLFNRDYPGLANSNYFHLENELKSYTKYRCLSSEQVRRLAVLFQTDREKYDFLSYAFNYVFDLENYAMTGSVLANRNARDAFYRFLVREGVPAGDYYNDPWVGAYPVALPPTYYPQQPPRTNQNYDNTYNNYPDPRFDNRNGNGNYPPQYADNQQGLVQPSIEINSKGLNGGFQGLMTYREFEALKERIKQNTFENGKLDAAKTLTRENTLTTNQVAEITRLFNFDNNRLEYAKYAFQFTYDRENYTAVTDALAFEKNREELRRHVQGRR
jgi:hypothetical protein